jgi:hypothetical protein
MTLVELFENNRYGWYGTDKGEHNYLRYYDGWFKKYKDEEINLLEVGVLNGHSIQLWKDYFTNAKIYGMEKAEVYGGDFKCDSLNKTEVDKALGDLKFDIIIDDGDHHPDSQLKTYRNLKEYLNKGGLYIIEDIYGPKHKNNRYKDKVDRFRSLGFNIVDTKGIFSISYLGVLRK